MHPVLPSIINGMETDDTEAFLGAGELMRAHKLGPHNAVIEPYASIYMEQPLDADDVAILKNALLNYLENDAGLNATAAVHALGELDDADMIPLLRNKLVTHLHKLMHEKSVVGQLNVVLSNLGEGVISGQSFDITEVDKNIADARRYLQKFGIMIPW